MQRGWNDGICNFGKFVVLVVRPNAVINSIINNYNVYGKGEVN